MVKTAQTHTCLDLPPSDLYRFDDGHRYGWASFWVEMKGDLDKIMDWAKKAEIEEPEGWTN